MRVVLKPSQRQSFNKAHPTRNASVSFIDLRRFEISQTPSPQQQLEILYSIRKFSVRTIDHGHPASDWLTLSNAKKRLGGKKLTV
jgi:hypothetical protein